MLIYIHEHICGGSLISACIFHVKNEVIWKLCMDARFIKIFFNIEKPLFYVTITSLYVRNS